MRIKYLVIILALAACGGGKKPEPAAPAGTLFTRLGGETGIKGVVKDFVENNVAKDERINKFFLNTEIPKFEQLLYDQICEAAGGPCKYTGKDMKTAHANMKVKAADFDALVEDLVKALDNAHVAPADKQTLLGVLGPMKSDIVTAQ
jgi:hemoglobin